MEMVPVVGGILDGGMVVAEGARTERCCGVVIVGDAVPGGKMKLAAS